MIIDMIIIALWVVFSFFTWSYADRLNRSGFLYFILSLLISPLLTAVILLMVGKFEPPKPIDSISKHYNNKK